MKKIKILITILLLFIGMSSVKAQRKFDTTKKIYDYAQILSESEENKLKVKIDKYIKKYNIDMVIVTVKHYNQNTLTEYMKLFYDTNKFGIGDNKSGIMFTLDLKNNDVGVKTFGIADGLYSNLEIDKILNKINKEKNYADKADDFIRYSNKYINEVDNIETKESILIKIDWVGNVIFAFIISVIIIFIGFIKLKTREAKTNTENYVKSLIITTSEDSFITTNTKKRRIGNKKN